MARAPAKLAKYREMRDFTKTAEPSGAEEPKPGHRFVVQKHAARRLHYDFRLELDGVLLSWAVPKGPSMRPGDRRLAVHVEDHPINYSDFEGIIPQGEYGGGTVVVWDRGGWTPEGDPRAAMAKGKLTFTLTGEKLRGRFHLVRTRGEKSWLLFKGRDDDASDTGDITSDRPESVISGRTVEEVAQAADRVWHSNREAKPTASQVRAARIAAKASAAPTSSARSATPEQIHALVSGLPLGFKLTNLDKVLFPEQGLTKGELIAYLAVVAEHMLPHVANRPLTIVRCPDGRHKPCFFQKQLLAGSPKSIHPLPLDESDGETVHYMTVDDMPGLAALAQLGTLEIHTWGAHADQVEKPDLMVFDLDPGEGVTWDEVALAAFQIRRRLDDLGFISFVKTTGGKGLHVASPIKRGPSWDEFKVHQARRRSGGARRPGSLHHQHGEGASPPEDLPRLPAQRSQRDVHRTLFAAGSRERDGRGAHHLGGARRGCRSEALYDGDGASPALAARARSVGRPPEVGARDHRRSSPRRDP